MEVNKVLEQIMNKYKGQVIKEFEKICPTEVSLHRCRKEMHDIFDELLKEIEERMQINH